MRMFKWRETCLAASWWRSIKCSQYHSASFLPISHDTVSRVSSVNSDFNLLLCRNSEQQEEDVFRTSKWCQPIEIFNRSKSRETGNSESTKRSWRLYIFFSLCFFCFFSMFYKWSFLMFNYLLHNILVLHDS